MLTPKMLKKNQLHHPELPDAFYGEPLKVLVQDPDVVVPNRNDPHVLIFYRACGEKYLRAAVLLPHGEKQRKYLPSVLSLRLAKRRNWTKI
ncbi:MAG: hypothetical protein H5T97_04110 [Firmicutes bacterium]|nr:hypothetical protein [Bacillota bacterium]